VGRAYHKIRGWVKGIAPTATSWGLGGAYGIVEVTICKAAYQFGRSLPLNDEGKKKRLLDDAEVLSRVLLKLNGKRFRADWGLFRGIFRSRLGIPNRRGDPPPSMA
jgi:hypothetical protein